MIDASSMDNIAALNCLVIIKYYHFFLLDLASPQHIAQKQIEM